VTRPNNTVFVAPTVPFARSSETLVQCEKRSWALLVPTLANFSRLTIVIKIHSRPFSTNSAKSPRRLPHVTRPRHTPPLAEKAAEAALSPSVAPKELRVGDVRRGCFSSEPAGTIAGRRPEPESDTGRLCATRNRQRSAPDGPARNSRPRNDQADFDGRPVFRLSAGPDPAE